MKQITVILPRDFSDPVVIGAISNIGLPGPPGPQGDTGGQGPGILSNISRITVSTTPPDDPEVNDLWVDIS